MTASSDNATQFVTHVYATVRVKVIGTNFSNDPALVADKVADAVAADPAKWFKPVHGSVTVPGHGEFDIEQVEYAEAISSILVDEIDPRSGSVIKEHVFCGDDVAPVDSVFTKPRT